MLILGIVLLVVGLVGLIVGCLASDDDVDDVIGHAVLGVLAFLGMTVIALSFVHKTERSTADYSVKTKINITYTNNIETSRDTVYIFTDKK